MNQSLMVGEVLTEVATAEVVTPKNLGHYPTGKRETTQANGTSQVPRRGSWATKNHIIG